MQSPQVLDRDELKRYLRSIGMTAGELVMAHTSVNGIRLTDGEPPVRRVGNFLETAKWLVDDLLELVGETGTLVMPTHAFYQATTTMRGPTRTPPGQIRSGDDALRRGAGQ